VPKGINIADYESPSEFFQRSGSSIEFFNEEEPLMVPANKIEI